MNKLYVIIVILFTNFIFAQKIKNIEYEVYYNTEIPNTQKSNLYFDESKDVSLYVKDNSKKDENIAKKNKEDNSIKIQLNSKRQSINYFNFKKDSLFTVEGIFGEDYLINEKIPEIKWTLVDEEKQIDGNKVYMATCYFRGRNYIAWYSLDYPFKYGPWKFYGLPGLIFEIYDETKRFNWLIKNIAYKDSSDKIFNVDFTGTKRIDIKQYAEKKYDTKDIREKLMSKLPRGSKIMPQNKPIRNGMETKFEWEE